MKLFEKIAEIASAGWALYRHLRAAGYTRRQALAFIGEALEENARK